MTEEQVQESLHNEFIRAYFEQRDRLREEVLSAALDQLQTIDWPSLKRFQRTITERISANMYIGSHHSPTFLEGVYQSYGMFHDDLHEYPLGYFVRHDPWLRRTKQKRLTRKVAEAIQSAFDGTLEEFLIARISIHEALQDALRGIAQLFEVKDLEDAVCTEVDFGGAGFIHLPSERKAENFRLSEMEKSDLAKQIQKRQTDQKSLRMWLKRVENSPEHHHYIETVLGKDRLILLLQHNAIEIEALQKVLTTGVVPESIPLTAPLDADQQVGRISINTTRTQSEKQSVSNVVRILETARVNRLFSDETSMTDIARILWIDGVQYSGEKYSNLRGRIFNNKDKHSGKTDSSLFADFVYDCFEQMSAAKKKEFRQRIKRPTDQSE